MMQFIPGIFRHSGQATPVSSRGSASRNPETTSSMPPWFIPFLDSGSALRAVRND